MHYVRELKPIADAELRLQSRTKQVDEAQQRLYMSLVGGLAWVVQTRPDIAVFVAALQRKLKQPTVQDLLDANRVLKYLKLKPLSLTYRRLQHPWRLVAISDSAFKSDGTDCLAMRSGVIALCNKDGIVKGTNDLQVLEFVSKKQSKVCRSTYAAELHSGLDLVGLAMVINAALCEVLQGPQTAANLVAMQDAGSMPLDLDLVIDAKSVWVSASADEPKCSDSAMMLHLMKLREMLQGVIRRIIWCDTRSMLADGLTKGSIERDSLRRLASQGQWEIQQELEVFEYQRSRAAVPGQQDA
jgi:hypothetical protein